MSDRAEGEPRDSRADWLKAAAIFGVVFIHAPGPPGHYPLVVRFCVPVFVVLWVYYLELGLNRRPPSQHPRYLGSRFLRLFIPYVVWTILYFPTYHTFADVSTTSRGTILDVWLGGHGLAGQYFFIILFQLAAVVPLVLRPLGRIAMWACLLAGPLLFPLAVAYWDRPLVNGVGDRFFLYWLPYAALGIGLARGYLPRLPAPVLLTIAVLALAAAPFEYQFIETMAEKPSAYLLVSVYVGSVALAWAALAPRHESTTTGVAAPPSGMARAASYVGQHTFPVFLTNPLLLGPFFLLLPASLVIYYPIGLVTRIVAALTAIGAGLIVGRTFKRMGLGRIVGE